tara:strand:+ start:264 stop:1502 length:1239 start_codon:yes stop_codon:yes gene_type:complete
MNLKKVLEEELKNIRPTKEEILKLNKSAKSFISLLHSKNLTAFIGGSLAKGTIVRKKDKQDLDIFVVFEYKEEIPKLERVLKKLKLPGKLKKIHGSRDYFRIECEDVILEVVPVVRNRKQELAENVTDFSLGHVKYISREIKRDPKLGDEIRLAKSFCRAQRFYGAESYIKGFSGYSLEILVINFKGFSKFLKRIGKSRIYDPMKHFRNEKEILRELNTSKMGGPIILIDPTYKYRNASAGLGFETFEKFLKVSKEFLKSPSNEFFKDKEIDVGAIKKLALKNKSKFIEISLRSDRQEGDIAGTKMKKFFDFFISELLRKQQKVLFKEFYYSGRGKKSKGYLIIKEKNEIDIRGPLLTMKEAVRGFKKAKGKKIFKKGKYFWTREKTGAKKVFNSLKKVEKEMGAGGKLGGL